jgi:hypothetical protein
MGSVTFEACIKCSSAVSCHADYEHVWAVANGRTQRDRHCLWRLIKAFRRVIGYTAIYNVRPHFRDEALHYWLYLTPTVNVNVSLGVTVLWHSANKALYSGSTKFEYSRDSSVGIALGYGLENRDSRVRFLTGAGNFSLHHRVQNGSGVHPASYPMGTRGSSPGDKAAGAWSWPLTSI